MSASERLTKIDPAIAAVIDHTILKPEATRADILKVCQEARQYGFASVCVNPYWVPLVRDELAGSTVKVCTVVGFPLGATSTEAKVAETAAAVREGAQAYLRRQYTTIAIVGVVIFVIVGYLLGWLVGIGFAVGAILSGAAGFVGMNVSVRANV
ncbi:MAG: sodium/proton-translocating pyrophosphatase, partial [Bryobacteraceae bacterium]